MPPKPIAPETRFWRLVNKGGPDDCWLWTGALSDSGYGVMQRGGRGQGVVKAHRFSYELHRGPIGAGQLALHRCNEKRCVNPAHLYLGDHSLNITDAWRDGLRVSRHSLKTHCDHGHPFDQANTLISYHRNGRPYRQCRACSRERARVKREQLGRLRDCG